LSNATKYENLWKESLTLKPFAGNNITEDGDDFLIKLNMTASQNSVIVFHNTIKTGAISASPEIVTEFTNSIGNTEISWSTQNSPRTLVTLTRTRLDGTEVVETFLSIKNNNPTGSVTRTISEGLIHTFKLYTGERDSDVLGDLLDTVIVYGGDNFLVYNDGAWVNGVAMDGTTDTKNAYIHDDLTLSSNVKINNLNILSEGSLTINSGSSLIVNGTSTGNVTYIRNLPTSNWYLVSSPVSGQAYNDSYVTANSIASGEGSNRGIASYTTTSNSWSYLQTAGSGIFNNGQGYSVKRTATGDISFRGNINTADVAVSVSNTGTGFNLLGNPFTSYVNSATFLTSNTSNLVSQTIWVWDQSSGNYESKLTFDSFVLAPAQGFFVQALNNNVSLTFAESNQATTGGTFQKTSTTKTEVRLVMNDGSNNRFAKIYYLDNVTKGFDNGYDGETFGGIENTVDVFTNLVANNEGKKYQVQSLPIAEMETMIVPVGVKAAAGKEITFTAEAMNLPNDLKVFLEDRLTNTITRLDEANTSYKVTLNDAINGTGRFYLHTNASGVLSTDDLALSNTSVYATANNTLRVVGLPSGNANVKIFNILGKQMMQTSFSSTGSYDVSLPKLATGMYIVQLETATGKLNKKIVLE
jgi:hypothetical protein